MVPPNVDPFIGRETEIHEVLSSMEEHRLVTIIGLPGIGKTSVALGAANFAKNRSIFRDGVIWISLSGSETSGFIFDSLFQEVQQMDPSIFKKIRTKDDD
jgi:AAA+ ATPase superfamily predicted ATPase